MRDCHPELLAVAARLFGFEAPSPATARVLDVGCASGGNLLPLALTHPAASFTGFDLSARQIANGQRVVRDLNVKNIHLEVRDLCGIGPQDGQFDYILIHGLFSWVPQLVQTHILRICRENLAPYGVAYVSHNTWPGWRTLDQLRQRMLASCPHPATWQQRIQQARDVLDAMIRSVDTRTPQGRSLMEQLLHVMSLKDAALLHDHLAEHNTPLYLQDVVSQAEASGMQFLCDANLRRSWRQAQDGPKSSRLDREQDADILEDRTFRQTLLCHREVPLNGVETVEALEGLSLSSITRSASSTIIGSPTTFRPAWGPPISILDPWLQAIVHLFMEQAPGTSCYEQLKEATGVVLGQSDPSALVSAIFTGFSLGLLKLHCQPVAIATAPAALPKALAYARYIAKDQEQVPSAYHRLVTLDALDQVLLPLLDGTRSHTALLNDLGQIMGHRRLVALGFTAERLHNRLTGYAHQALLVP